MLENRIRKLLNCLKDRLSTEDFYNIKEFIEYNEYGIAVETICVQLYEYDTKITLEIRNLIIDLIMEMNLDIDLINGVSIEDE